MDNKEKVRESVYNPQTKTYNYVTREYKVPFYQPTVSWWKTGDPNTQVPLIESKLTEINVIRCKYISKELRNLCIKYRDKIFLHLYISGLNSSVMEPMIPTVKEVFMQMKELFDLGFPQRQILVVVDPIIQNDNGLKMLELILRVFTELNDFRLRKIRLSLLWYKESKPGQFVVANRFIQQRPTTRAIENFIIKVPSFMKEYFKIMEKYQSIICVDNCDEAIIGVRELNALGYKNEWIDSDGKRRRIIEYKDAAKRWEPIVKVISGKSTRCHNRCLLCPFYG